LRAHGPRDQLLEAGHGGSIGEHRDGEALQIPRNRPGPPAELVTATGQDNYQENKQPLARRLRPEQ
jgi:hypothetical protein